MSKHRATAIGTLKARPHCMCRVASRCVALLLLCSSVALVVNYFTWISSHGDYENGLNGPILGVVNCDKSAIWPGVSKV